MSALKRERRARIVDAIMRNIPEDVTRREQQAWRDIAEELMDFFDTADRIAEALEKLSDRQYR